MLKKKEKRKKYENEKKKGKNKQIIKIVKESIRSKKE